MESLFYFFIFILGLFIGSFLNCVIYRLEKEETFLKSRSYCPNCKHILSWQDLIPIFSFLILKGKCRYCQKPISLQEPAVELATGIIFFLIILFNIQYAIFYVLISCFLIVIFVYDLKHYLIPDEVIYPAIVITLVYDLLKSDFHWKSGFMISAFGAAAFFLFIVLVSRGRWMGVGDIKLAFLMGLILSFPNILVAMFLSFFIGAAIGIGLIILRKKSLKSEVPFGPFLVTGTLLALFCGQNLINWYLNLF